MPAKPKDFSRYANDISMDRYTLAHMQWEDAIRVRDSYPAGSGNWSGWNEIANFRASQMSELDK